MFSEETHSQIITPSYESGKCDIYGRGYPERFLHVETWLLSHIKQNHVPGLIILIFVSPNEAFRPRFKPF